MTASIGRYRIVGELGMGGMGVVYRAEDGTLRRAVALKFLAPDLASDEEYRARFLREARVAASLNHPNTCVVYEVGEVDVPITLPGNRAVAAGTPFIAMELVEGDTLAGRLAHSSELTVQTVVDVALQLAEGLAEAHARQIVHRDLKPQNVMMTSAGRVKIVDFGLAKPITSVRDAKALASTSEMISAELGPAPVIGTCAYMSPEQATGRPLDARSDVFSFGILLYQMIAGRLPFYAETATETLAKILEADPAPLPPTAIAGGTFAPLVRRCLEKKPDDRYADAGALLRDLREVASGLSEVGPTTAGTAKAGDRAGATARRRWLVAPAVGLLALLAAWPFMDDVAFESNQPARPVTNGVTAGALPERPAPSDDATDNAAEDSIPPARPPEPPLVNVPPRQRPDPPMETPVRPEPLPPSAGSLNVTSTPRASISVDGNLVGVTPMTLDAGPGTHEIILTGPDGLRWRGRVEIQAGQVYSVHRNLNVTGSLSVVSDLWAEVSLDERPPEQTPIHFPQVTAGLHSVRVFRPGYVTQVLEIFIEEGKASSLRITLEKEP